MIEFKGIREGILITIEPVADWGNVVAELTSRIDTQAGFFRGATAVLQLDQRAVQRSDLARLTDHLKEREVQLMSVLSTSATTQAAARQLGLEIDLSHVSPARPLDLEQPPEFPDKLFDDEVKGSTGLLIRRTLRSGRVVRTPGHVAVLGDVNPGAEIIAGGDIIVWGHLRGTVHAGAMGDEASVICALNLQPTQLRIGSLISVSPPPNKRRKPRPECAFVEDGEIRAETWEQ